MAPRNGFIIKNAADAALYLDEAEPDALDFNLLGNHRYGVISGCAVSLGSGWSVTVTAGTAVVDSAVVKVTSPPINLPLPGTSPRFDLITIDSTGKVWYERGTPSPNPVFPEYADGLTIIAAIYVDPGNTSPGASSVTDKRIMLSTSFKRPLDSGIFLGSYKSADLAPQWEVNFQGQQRWTTGSLLSEISPLTLGVHTHLTVEGTTTTDDLLAAGDVTAGGHLAASNFQRGSGPPTGTASLGDLYQDTLNGGVYTYTTTGWSAMATSPFWPGFIMETLRDDEPPGWLFLNGQQVDMAHAGGLWTLKPTWIVSTPSGNRLQLPDFRNSYTRQGPLGNSGGHSSILLTIDNLPPHRHLSNASGQSEPAGAHGHDITIQPAGGHGHYTLGGQGEHGHPVQDPGHQHVGAWPGGSIIAQVWGGPWRLDGPFNDASHPTAVGAIPGINYAQTGIAISGGGQHGHTTNNEPSHVHQATASPATATHVHDIDEDDVGGGVPFDNNPPYNCVNFIIKT